MNPLRPIAGYDYRPDTRGPVERTRDEWRAEIAKLVKAGGRRRVEGGETYGHAPNGRIAFEVYANITLSGPDPLLL